MSSETVQDLVLLHGFTHTGASWQPVISGLGQRYRPIALDIRGHGRASQDAPVTLAAVLGDVAALAPERFALGGYSMGGRIALHAALAWPDRIERLVLVSASPGLAGLAERTARREADERLAGEIEASGIDEFARRWAATPVLAGASQEVRATAHTDRLRNTPIGLAAALRNLGTGALPSLWARLPELAMPVVLIVGERDQKFRAIAVQMTARIPHATVEVVPAAGHAVHLENPAAVARLLIVGA